MTTARARLVKWGNSRAVRIPKAVLERARLKGDEDLEIRVEGRRIALQVAEPRRTLADLVAAITPRNRHREQEWGRPVGYEPW